MELQFNKTIIPYLSTLKREVQTQELTQEVRLTDGMPDIGKILASWGQILLRGKHWNGGGAGANGGVMVWVLYEPEDDTGVQCMETWLPFQMKWDFDDMGRDGSLWVQPLLRSVDARSLSARKIMVRSGIGLLGQAMLPVDAEIYTPNEVPQDICLLKNTYPMMLPKEAGEKEFSLEETLSLPSSSPAINKILRYTAQPELTDSKVVGDKVVMRGAVNLTLLYLDADGQIHNKGFELPFSQYAQLDHEYSGNASAKICLAVTVLELEQAEEENLNLKTGLTGQYVICDRSDIELVEDAYSLNRALTPAVTNLQLPTVLDRQTDTVRGEHTVDMNGIQPVDVTFYPDHPQLYRQSDKLGATLSGVFQILGYDQDGSLRGGVSRWQSDMPLSADSAVGAQMSVQPTGTPQAMPAPDGVGVRGDMLSDTEFFALEGMPMLTGMELGQWQESNPDRPSLIIRRAGDNRLWDIAKQTNSTVEAIEKTNNLQQEPTADQLLLIPVL